MAVLVNRHCDNEMRNDPLERFRAFISPRSTISPSSRVFVVGAYVPNGGTYMAYHLGRILHLEFGLECIAVRVGNESSDNGIFQYDVDFPDIEIGGLEHQITPHDLLIANPSFSNHFFGLRLLCRKLMYIQDFKTYALLDRNFDYYVSVSRFVAKFVKTVYDLSVPVIPAFVKAGPFKAIKWQDRPAASIIVHLKGDAALQEIFLARLRDAVARRRSGVDLDNILTGVSLAHDDLLARIGTCRYFLSLSAAEGFGLVPLEAMSMGATVIGFDAFGGREYMKPGRNCLVTSYPDIDGVAERLILALESPAYSEHLAGNGRITASHFGYERFRLSWRHQFRRFLKMAE